jgi:amino-acid N-acetyltransferase
MRTRSAILPDAKRIHELIASYSTDGTLLPRTLPEICENIRDFVVVEQDGSLTGCGALHLYGVHLAEIRSIAVHRSYQGGGAGRQLVEKLLSQAKKHHVTCVCLFTRIPEFFARLGFAVATRDQLPDKVYKDCCNCPRLHYCDEVAMIRGELPKFSILQPLATAIINIQNASR